jgi:pimeloyl-ACP methyl ester carboxylesterase
MPLWRGLRFWLVLLVTLGLLSWIFLVGWGVLNTQHWFFKLIWTATLVYPATAILSAYRDVSPLRFPIYLTNDWEPALDVQEVEFSSRDGLLLSGWYIPPQNGAVIILAHGFSGNRMALLPLARGLVEHGFGVLLFDFRAHGRSAGKLCTWGWQEQEDILGAVDMVKLLPELNAEKIGIFGFSMGGSTVLRAAARDSTLSAVAVDDPSFSVLADHRFAPGWSAAKLFLVPWLWLLYQYQSWLTGVAQPGTLYNCVGQINPRPLLLISTGRGAEQRFVRALYTAASEPKVLWEFPQFRHGDGWTIDPVGMTKQLATFFQRTMMGDSE